MTKEEYKSSPARASSLPLWKTNSVKLPEGMLILRDDLFSERPKGIRTSGILSSFTA